MTQQDLLHIAKSRYQEAKILLENGKPEGSVYLCGYALELMLKRRILKLLEWDEYPESDKRYTSFKIHDLSVLLRLAGLEKKIKIDPVVYLHWQVASQNWSVNMRYENTGNSPGVNARDMISGSKVVLSYLKDI